MADRPNIILCMCDELRAFEVGCYGHPTIRTPNIDRIARDGACFETAVSNAPVCMAARSVTLAGQYARTCCGHLANTTVHTREGTWFMPQWPTDHRPQLRQTTLPEVLRDAGYHTAAIGKWHIESWPDDVGFDHYIIPRVHHAHTAQNFIEDGGPEFSPPGWTVDYELDRVKHYLQQRRGDDKPFFLFYNISPPHMPLDDAPNHYKNMYRNEDVVVRRNVDPARPVHKQDWEFPTYLWDFRYYRDHLPYTRKLPEGFDLVRLMAMYMGLTTWVDDAVGGMLGAVESLGLNGNTIVVFTSDHGDNLGSHGFMGKMRLIEESIRIPLVVRGPGIPAGRSPRQIASLVDLAPTLLTLAGATVPWHMQGRDLTPVLHRSTDELPDNHAIIEAGGEGLGVRTPTHLLGFPWQGNVRTIGPQPHRFHDLTTDPFELRNLVGTGEQTQRMSELERLVRAFDRQTPWMDTTPVTAPS